MKMFCLAYSCAALCLVLFASGAVSGETNIKAVGGEVSLRPASTIPAGASIIWKHTSTSGGVIKVIEYDDEDGEKIPNSNFKSITTLDKKTGEITIKSLTIFHSGVYTIDINSKEQEQRFSLTVKERVPKPKITSEIVNEKVAYLKCEYDEKVTKDLTVIWKNSTGETVKTLKDNEQRETITVHSTGNPGNYYTCTLDNIASAETSEKVKEEELFKEESSSGPWWIVIVILIIGGIVSILGVYKFNNNFHKLVDDHVSCKKGNAKLVQYNAAPKDDVENPKTSDNTKSDNGGEETNKGADANTHLTEENKEIA